MCFLCSTHISLCILVTEGKEGREGEISHLLIYPLNSVQARAFTTWSLSLIRRVWMNRKLKSTWELESDSMRYSLPKQCLNHWAKLFCNIHQMCFLFSPELDKALCGKVLSYSVLWVELPCYEIIKWNQHLALFVFLVDTTLPASTVWDAARYCTGWVQVAVRWMAGSTGHWVKSGDHCALVLAVITQGQMLRQNCGNSSLESASMTSPLLHSFLQHRNPEWGKVHTHRHAAIKQATILK